MNTRRKRGIQQSKTSEEVLDESIDGTSKEEKIDEEKEQPVEKPKKRSGRKKEGFIELSEVQDELNPWTKLGHRKKTLALSYVQKIKRESLEQREKRLEHIRRLNRQRLQCETPEQREKRLKVLRENAKKRRQRLNEELRSEGGFRRKRPPPVVKPTDFDENPFAAPVDVGRLRVKQLKEHYASVQITASKADEFLTLLEEQGVIIRGFEWPEKQLYVLHSFWKEGIVLRTVDFLPKSPLPLIQLPKGLIKPFFTAFQSTSRYIRAIEWEFEPEFEDNAISLGPQDLFGLSMTYKEWVELGMPDINKTETERPQILEEKKLSSKAPTLLMSSRVKEEVEEEPEPIHLMEFPKTSTDLFTIIDDKKDCIKLSSFSSNS